MTKSHKRHRVKKSSNVFKNIRTGTKKAIPIVASGLKNVGITAKVVAEKSAPVLEKSVSTVYGALATGFDMGIKGANSVAKGVSKMSRHTRTKHTFKKTKTRRH